MSDQNFTKVGELASNYNFGHLYGESDVRITRDAHYKDLWVVSLSDGTNWVRTSVREWRVSRFYAPETLSYSYNHLFAKGNLVADSSQKS